MTVRRRQLWIVLAGCGLVLGTGAWFLRTPVPPPPVVDLTGADPAIARAIERARAALRESPRSGEAWGRLGMTLDAHGFAGPARECYRQAERLEPEEARWPYFTGVSLSFTDLEAALPGLRRAAELLDDDRPAAVRLRLAELLLELDRLDEASAEFGRVLRVSRDSARARLGLARLELRRGNLQESLAQLERCEGDATAGKAARLLLAQVHARLGNRALAEQERREAAGLEDRSWPDPYLAEISGLRRGLKTVLVRGDVLIGTGRFGEAAVLLERAVRDYPRSAWAWILLGRARLKLRQLDAAEAALHRALDLEPESVEARFRLGFCRILREDYHGAIDWFRGAIERKPDFARAHFNLGGCLSKLGDRPAAIEALRAAVQLEHGNVQAHVLLGQLLAASGELQEAAEHLREASALDPSDRTVRSRLEQLGASR